MITRRSSTLLLIDSIIISGVATGVQAVQWTGAPELLGPRARPQKIKQENNSIGILLKKT